MQMADELRGVISLQNNVTPVLREIIKGLKEMGADSKSAQKAMESLEDLNLSGAQNETRKAASEVENVGKEAEKSESLVGKLKKALIALGATTAITGLVKSGIEYNAGIEDYTTAFTTMLGDAEEASKLVQKLNKMGAETPFETSVLLEVTQLLMNYGQTADQAVEKMSMLGDIAQGNADKMVRVATAYGQMSSAGKVSLEDVKQMIEAGFNPLQEISQATGESMASLYERISKGTISVDEITDSMKRATSEGGKYYKSMEAQSQTFSGMLATLKDNTSQLLGVATSALFEGFKDTLSEINAAMSDGESADALAEAAKKVGEFMGDAASAIKSVITTLWEHKTAVLAAVGAMAGFKVVQTVASYVKAATTTFNGLKIALTAVKAAKAADASATLAQATAQAKANVEAAAGESATAAQKAAISGLTKVTNAQTTAQKALNMATKVAPWAAVTAFIGGVITAGQKAEEIMQKIPGSAAYVRKAIEEVNQSLEESAGRIQEAERDASVAGADAEAQIYQIQRAMAAGFDDDVIKEMVDTLESTYPVMEGYFDFVNGKWQESTENVQRYIEEIKKQAVVDMYRDELSEAAKNKAKAQETKDAAQKAYDENHDKLVKESNEAADRGDHEAQQRADSKLEELSKNLEAADAALQEATKQEQEISDKVIDTMASGQDAVQGYIDEITQADKEYAEKTAAISDVMEKLAEFDPSDKISGPLADSLNETLKAAGVDFTVQAEDTIGDLIEKLIETETDTNNEYLTNMAALAQGLLDTFGGQLDDEATSFLKGLIKTNDDNVKNNKNASRESAVYMSKKLKDTNLTAELKNNKVDLNATVNVKSTISSSGASVSLLGGAGAMLSKVGQTISATVKGHNATGTPYYKGGLTTINENGDEIIDLPNGSRVYTAAQSRKIIENKKHAGGVIVNIANMIVREEADIDKIAAKLAEKIDKAALVMA